MLKHFIPSLFILYHLIEGEECIEDVHIQHIGHDQMTRNRVGICPQLDFRCNARITRIRVRTLPDPARHDYPYIQVWRPLQQGSRVYNKVAQVQVNQSQLIVHKHYEANMSLTGANRIHVQLGDTIGYCHPFDAGFKVRTIQTRGYELYEFRGYNSTVVSLNLDEAYRRYTPRQPLITFELGK